MSGVLFAPRIIAYQGKSRIILGGFVWGKADGY